MLAGPSLVGTDPYFHVYKALSVKNYLSKLDANSERKNKTELGESVHIHHAEELNDVLPDIENVCHDVPYAS